MRFWSRPPAKPPASSELPQEWPPGHYYSPIPAPEDVKAGLAAVSPSIPGVDLNEAEQDRFLDAIRATLPLLTLPRTPSPGRRYHYDNGSFGALDAVCLASMLRRFRPRRIVEVGCGHSSAALLDFVDDGLAHPDSLTFIDPDLSRLQPLLRPEDAPRVTLLNVKVQDSGFAPFDALESGDLLFIDSSHVSKIGSDVNHLVFQLLPRLRSGVVVHVHDVFESFEYPAPWLASGRYWNEQYLLRAFLMFNSAYEVLLVSSALFNRCNAFFREEAPVTLESGGGQLWLRRR